MEENQPLAKELASLCEELSALVSVLGSAVNGQSKGVAAREARLAVVRAAEAIATTAKPPDALWPDLTVNLAEIAAVRLLLKWEAFEQIPLEGSISSADLASRLDAEPGLIARITRMLISTGLLARAGPDLVAHTPRSRILVTDPEFAAICHLTIYPEFPQPVATPEYFATYGRREPVAKTHTPYAFARGAPEQTVWEVMNADAAVMRSFMTSMRRTQEYLSITGVYDFAWVAAEAQKSAKTKEAGSGEVAAGDEDVLLVDVGGGGGHTLRTVLEATPGLPRERCVLQDRPEVIAEAGCRDDEALRGVRMMGIDFHHEQPVKGALVYLLRRCLHDYSDDECAGMLKHIANAMTRRSTLLIMELALTPASPPLCYAVDLTMMAISGKERTLEDWEALVARAGLRIAKVFPGPGTTLTVLECVRL